jgi:hypothetical protein
MDKPHTHSQKSQSNPWTIKTEEHPPDIATYPISSSENSFTSCGDDNNIIEFGPIKVKPRKKPAPTLATGRRSKYETLSPEEEEKRDIRRARNRAAAERVRISRLNVEQQLQGQIDTLEDQEQQLSNNIQMLQNEKLHLETRLLTHKKICSTMTVSNVLDNLPPAFTSNNTPVLEQVSELNFDELFSHSSSSVQIQQNYTSNLLTTMMSGDDFDDLFMDL